MEKIGFTVREVAQLTGLHRNTVFREIYRGNIKAVKFARRLLIPRYELERLGLLPKENPAGAGGER